MFRKFRSVLSFVLAWAIGLSALTFVLSQPAAFAEAKEQAVPLSATRYRYPIMRFENAKFRTGMPIDDNTATSAYLSTDNPKANGPDPMDLLNAYVGEYDMFRMKVGKNKALFIDNKENTLPMVTENYTGYNMNFGEEVDTRENILPDSIQGIPIHAKDHGIMFHVEVAGTPEHPEDGFSHLGFDAENMAFTEEKSTHEQRYVNVTFQEWDYKPDGTPKKKKGKVVCTAMNIKPGANITLIWTKNIDWDNPDKGKAPGEWSWKNTEYVHNPDGTGVQVEAEDGTKSYERQLIPDRHKKPGDTEILVTPQKTLKGVKEGGGSMEFPRDFCGYVIIPFSEFQLCWDGADYDGLLNFKKMEMAPLTFGSYPYHRGRVVYDEYCFWGPTFAKVNGAYDYGSLTIDNHRDSLINRKRITVKEEKPSEEPSRQAPAEIKKDVTLLNKQTGITIEAPSSAKLSEKTAFNVECLDPDGTDYAKQLYDRLFGKDRSKFRPYNLYLGEDGDQEPADFVQINFPVPQGFDGTKCKVYTLSTDTEVDKLPVESVLSEDGKTLSVKVSKLGTYIIALEDGTGGALPTESETASQSDATEEKDSQPLADGQQEEQEKKTNLTWLWISLGVLGAAGIAAAVVLIVRKKRKSASEPEKEEAETEIEKEE